MKHFVTVSTGVALAAAGALTGAGHARTETFTIMSVSDPATSTVIATGRFGAGGTDDSGSTADHLTFPDGKLTLDHHGTKKTSVDAATCVVTTTGAGTFTLADGTGAYRGMRGSGRYRFSVRVVLARAASGACDRDADPAAFEYLVHGRGKVAR